MGSLYRIANSGLNLVLLVAFSWLMGAVVFVMLEDISFLDAAYWSMTTMSTVGYGDLSPSSSYGKVFTIAFQAWSIFVVVPNAVAHVIDKVRRDEHKFTHAEQEWHEEALKRVATALNVELDESPRDTDYEG